MLQGKTAIVYGAAGSIGAAVARAYAREGAKLYLAGRTEQTLESLASQIRAAGSDVDATVVDALDRDAVEAHAARVAAAAGGIDIAFNATPNDDLQGAALLDMTCQDFMRPVEKAVTTQFLIATAVARYMTAHRVGVILAMGGGPRSNTAARRRPPSLERPGRTLPATGQRTGTPGLDE